MHEELKRQRIKGLIEGGGVADEALQHPLDESDRAQIGSAERYVRRRPVLMIVVVATVLVSLTYSTWALIAVIR